MDSSILTSRNETYMGKTPLSNPRLKSNSSSNPNPNSKSQKQFRTSNSLYADESPSRNQQSVPEDAASYNRKPAEMSRNGQFHLGEYKTVDFAAYSRAELKELKRSFLKEIDQIRSCNDRIGSGELLQFRASSSQSLPIKKNPSKKNIGLKRQLDGPGVSNGDQKRKAAENAALLKNCSHILMKLMKHKQGWIFNAPVDAVALGLHDYFQIVKNPMDLGTIKMKMGKGLYTTPMEFAADVRLTFKNALLYNPKGHDVYLIAEQLLAYFEGMFRSVAEKYLEEQEQQLQPVRREKQKFVPIDEIPESSWNNSKQVKAPEKVKKIQENVVKKVARPLQPSSVISNSVSRPPPVVQSPVPTPSPKRASPVKSVVKKKQPKPKAKDPNKREMSMEEKHKLGMALQSLPEEKMAQVVQIIKKRNGHLTEVGDEIELDIEAVDKETLWELDRFVTYWKKMVSKIRRQALMENPNNATTSENKMALVDGDNGTSNGKKWSNGDGVEGDEEVDIDDDDDDDIPTASILPLQIDKDEDQGHVKVSSGSSSSSSSSSGSSSSSDSDSSSGSDSDADNAQSRDLSKT